MFIQVWLKAMELLFFIILICFSQAFFLVSLYKGLIDRELSQSSVPKRFQSFLFITFRVEEIILVGIVCFCLVWVSATFF